MSQKNNKNENNKEIHDLLEDNKLKDENSKVKKSKNYIKIKKTLPLIVAIIISLGVGFYGGKEIGRSLPATHKSYSKSQVIATVGDTKITGDDFNKKMEPLYYYQGLKKLSNEEIETYETNTINYMTNLEVLYQAAKDEKITVTNDEVDSNYDTTMGSIASTYNMSEDEFLKKFNLSKDYVKKNLKKEMIATKFLTENSKVTEKEAKNYYNKNKADFKEISASHILISNYDDKKKEISDDKKKENKKLAEKILKKALAGDSFADLALENSNDTYTSSKGGDLGFFGEGEMEDNFDKAVFSLKVGEIYPKVVETSYGYHIIKKTGEQYSNFDELKKSLIESLSSDKQSNILKNAQEKYKVKVNM